MGRQVGAIARPLEFAEFMELVGGPQGESVFASEEDREAAWRYHHEQLMERRGSQAGDRPWGYWIYDLNLDEQPATYLEKVLLLEERGLLPEWERREIISHAEHTRDAPPCQAFVSPQEARESMKRREQEHKEEAIALLEALERCR